VSQLKTAAQAINFSVQLSPSGMAVCPKHEGSAMTSEEYQ